MKRREFLRLASVGSAAVWGTSLVGSTALWGSESKSAVLSRYAESDPSLVKMGGVWGESLRAGIERLARPPFDRDFILADLNFNQKRWFTNFSGDISGRFVETNATVSKKENPQPAALAPVLAAIPDFQKADGHFGAECDWSRPVDFATASENALVMPILWGNGRLLLGLTAAYERFGDSRIGEAARKLGDFYLETVIPRFCDPGRMAEYQTESSGYAAAYVTCVYEGMEGLIKLGMATGDEKYRNGAVRMADFHEAFDVLPVRHSHGSLSQTGALVLLYEETGERHYLDRAITRRRAAVEGGYVNPCGSVLEKFVVTGHNQDEGCSEGDWLRLNLRLWRHTGDTACLDSIERLLWNGWLANQWTSGGFGHRLLGVDETGPFSYQQPLAESLWCCSFHCPLALYELQGILAVGEKSDSVSTNDKTASRILVNFPGDFRAPITNHPIAVRSRLTGSLTAPVTEISLEGEPGVSTSLAIRQPEWSDGLVVCRDGQTLEGRLENGYVKILTPIQTDETLEVRYLTRPYFEDRRLHRRTDETTSSDLTNVVLRCGPAVLVARDSDGTAPENLSLRFSDGAVTGWEETLEPFAEMTRQDWERPHTFVFNVTATDSTD